METIDAAVTVRVAEPVIPARLAVILTVPGLSAVAIPLAPGPLSTVAMAAVDEAHQTVLVTSSVEPSEYTPVAARGF